MPDILVSVSNKIASLGNSPTIVCGNSDYIVKFTFDSEFAAYDEKTLRVNFREKGKLKHYDILFQGNEVALPAMYAVDAIAIGVVAGDVISSTPVVIPCLYGDSAVHDDPPPDVYQQLLDMIDDIEPGGGNIIIGEIVGGRNPIEETQVCDFEIEDTPEVIPKMAAPEMPESDTYRVRGSTTVAIPDEYYPDATALAILCYQNGGTLSIPEGWTIVNDPSAAALTYTPAETPQNLFDAATWLSGLYKYERCTATKDTTNGTLTYTLQALTSTQHAHASPYWDDPNDTGHPPYKLPVTASLDYIFQCTITNANAEADAIVNIYGNGDKSIRLASIRQTHTENTLTAKFTVPAGVTYVTFWMIVQGPAESGSTVTFSNISVKVDAKNQRIAIYKKHLTREDKTASFEFSASYPSNFRAHVEGLLIVKSGGYTVSVLDSGTANSASYTPDSSELSRCSLLYAVAAPMWYGSQCAIQVSGGTSSSEDKLHTVDYMRLSATYDIGKLPMQTEPTFTSSFPVTTGFNGTMQYYVLKLVVNTDE